MEIVSSNPNKPINWEVYVFNIGYLVEGDRVHVYYLSSWRHFEIVVNRSRAGFCSKGVNLTPRASSM